MHALYSIVCTQRHVTRLTVLFVTMTASSGAQFIECIVIASHEASSDNELSVKKGENVTVLNRENNGK